MVGSVQYPDFILLFSIFSTVVDSKYHEWKGFVIFFWAALAILLKKILSVG